MRAWSWRGLALSIAAVASACSVLEPRRDDTRYYVLASSDQMGTSARLEASSSPVEATPNATASTVAAFGVGPVTLPAYLARSGIVRRSSATELEPSNRHVWAEPLDRALARVLARDLALALDAPAVARYPWQAERAPRWQIAVDVARFEIGDSGAALLVADWRAIEWPARVVRLEREARFEAASAPDVAAQTRALSELVDRLAHDVARAVSELR